MGRLGSQAELETLAGNSAAPYLEGSTGRGLCLIAWMALGAVGLGAGSPISAPSVETTVCRQPIDLDDGRGAFGWGCIVDLDPSCGSVRPGDRVRLDERGCTVTSDGMRSENRLLRGVPFDLNRLSSSDLALLPGLGPTRAASIVENRDRQGPFRRVEDLVRVRGIGHATSAKVQRFLIVR